MRLRGLELSTQGQAGTQSLKVETDFKQDVRVKEEAIF
jgi:hypothetical protein